MRLFFRCQSKEPEKFNSHKRSMRLTKSNLILCLNQMKIFKAKSSFWILQLSITVD
ncbi:hypothetical protein LINGRAHAP2_LOCUS30680 [Linum grandiflorum]